MTSIVTRAVSKFKIQIEDIVWHKSISGTALILLNIIYRRKIPMPVAVYNHFTGYGEKNGEDNVGYEVYIEKYMLPEEGKCLVDIGASVGEWTVFAAKAGRQVYAFEPSPKAFDILKKRTQKYPNVHVYSYALGDKNGVGRLGLAALSLSGTMDVEINGLHKGGTIDIPLRSLDSLDIPNIGIIKIDTEGYETPILQGAKETIEKNKPRLIIEVHKASGKAAKTFPEELQRIRKILKDYNYTWESYCRRISLRDLQPHIVAEPKI
jgi:FkbM family methyltransferase